MLVAVSATTLLTRLVATLVTRLRVAAASRVLVFSFRVATALAGTGLPADSGHHSAAACFDPVSDQADHIGSRHRNTVQGAQCIQIGDAIKALGIGGDQADAFGGKVDGNANDALRAVGTEMHAAHVVAADSLLVADQIRAQILAQHRSAVVHHIGKALVDEAGNALAAEAVRVDDVGCGDAIGLDDIGGNAGKIFAGHAGLRLVDSAYPTVRPALADRLQSGMSLLCRHVVEGTPQLAGYP